MRSRTTIARFALALLFGGCANAMSNVASTPVPAPAAPKKIAADRSHVAILAGNDKQRAVFVVDSSGVIVRSFGVSPFDVDLSIDSASGTLLTAYARDRIGAVEKWAPSGKQLASIALPMPAIAVSNVLDGRGFVLVGNNRVRTAIEFDANTARLGHTVPLDRGVSSIARSGSDQLAYISPITGDLEFKNVSTGSIRTTRIPGDSVTCSVPDKRCFVLTGARGSRNVEIVNADAGVLYARLPAIRGTCGIAVDEAGDLAIVGGDSEVGAFERFTAQTIDHLTPATIAS